MMDGGLSKRTVGLASFRAKFILVVGGAVLFDLLVSGGLALWNVQRLSRDATLEVGQGLEAASQEYIRTYADSTAAQVNLLLRQVHNDVDTLAGVLQAQIDNPARNTDVGAAIARTSPDSVSLSYDEKGKWSQNAPGSASVVSVWGYLLGQDHQPKSEIRRDIETSAVLDLVAPSLLQHGASKLQMYYIGPRERPIFRTAPYTDQAQTFDRLYPGHNEADFWNFFFPGLYESWQGWARDMKTRPVADDITQTAPYTDAITGKLIVSFFHPLWTADRKDVAGTAGADITLDQLAQTVENVKVAQSGFGFLAMSDGNVVAINSTGEETLGLRSASDASGTGVTGLERSLKGSSQPAIAKLALDREQGIQHLLLQRDGNQVPYIVIVKKLPATNLWSSGPVRQEAMLLGVVVPEREIDASLYAAQAKISEATNRIVIYQILAILMSLLIVTIAVFAASKRITSGISALAGAAKRIQAQDYSVRVAITSKDEVGAAGEAFNRMAEQISYHTENLEQLVEERTAQIEDQKEEISTLNAQLERENRRLGTELAVAERIQLMVLPLQQELEEFQDIEIAAYMRPAEEVGGDYYDVLKNGKRLKIGIGDVTGHGLESGVLMLMVQSVARALQEAGNSDAVKFLANLNSALFKNIVRTRIDKHLTLAFLDYDGKEMILSGQHEEVVIVRANGEIQRIDTMDLGIPIGLEADISTFIKTREIAFEKGDLILLHTDGVTEAANDAGELFGIERLCREALRLKGQSAEKVVSEIVAALMLFIGSQKIYDDITLLAVRHR
ncbi:SpoIIE family protein phosphatase [Rhizobium bangladeshense]|uniref:SpoIIE family protein phosphatase n=2 Tax=Rhizobium/Agrobacterium group TaxID=227290 RepID=UPI001B339C25|nr:SpoIIE family protein phosphatase [Rhizobium bangladeshense]MBX5243206.1 SpoIIE family protein phosphatase [Rhizobium sp. NLR3b]MBX5248993.1 SpoIIE family protein phosphatase [Rhizobium sp. NLR4b]MBX5255668.1 SpoIIE family protein phosphatase [Rhizobium sp. NLR16b]MBX5261762.1 SpoIIE family protein phosphatase [Rhizobium sp. NLR16a]MBX5267853.1 SpoIIE family protein phosphatase [Rhizobium sp. NLR17b]MBX5297836.1 SpoIIE family protein phosphatase [Rhizobium sp. NLR12b]MBX5304438.1 SpoIIE f